MELGPPRVSIIIPTHNRSHLLRVAVESTLVQTYPHIELIVVDDGSTDDTATAMAQYAGQITYLRQANQNVAVARNTGIGAATGEYLTFLDDDDWIMPDKIARQVQAMLACPEIGIVHCRYYYANSDGKLLARVGLLPEGNVLPDLLCGNFFWVGAPLVRRQCLEQVGGFDQEIPPVSADWDLWLRIALAGYPVACVQEPLGVYRIQQNSMLARVEDLERATVAILGKVFADPRLGDDTRTMREQAYSAWRFWIGCRYYAAGRWADGRRNLEEALAQRREWLAHPIVLASLLVADALSPRVSDPLAFVAGVLDHPPAGAELLEQYRPKIVGLTHLGLALRSYEGGWDMQAVIQAQSHLTQAVRLDPELVERPAEFVDALQDHALHLPAGEPLHYVEHVLENLPPEARRLAARKLAGTRGDVLSQVNIGRAFEEYALGHWASTAHRVWAALRHRPAWLKDRGVLSILVRSLLALALKRRRAC